MSEATRIREAYERRDAEGGPGIYRPGDPALEFHVAEVERALLDAVDIAGRTVLDVGCGSGDMLARMVELGAAGGAGIDLVEGRIGDGRRRHPQLDLRSGDAAHLPWGDGEFGVVTQFTCLSSVLDDEVRAQILREMWRVGEKIVSYDLRVPPAPVRLAGRALAGRAPQDPMPVRPLTLGEIRAALPRTARVDARVVSLNFALAGVARRSRAVARALAALHPLRSHLLVAASR